MKRLMLALLALLLLSSGAQAEDRFITLASTTSTENSGLFAFILPKFVAETGIFVRVVAVGTGQAIKIGERGDADVLLVHDRKSEDAFVTDGFGIARRDVMANDFVIVGPGGDPAGIAGLKDVADALRRIAAAEAAFVSRGDDSGTHKSELRHWQAAGVDPKPASGTWYREAGAGMGATLNTAAGMDAYTLADRATWASFGNRGSLRILVEGAPELFNPYGVILVNPAKYPHVKEADARTFIDWITSPKGRAAIAAFKIKGDQVFFPTPPAGS